MKITTTLNNKHYESPLTREQLIALLDTDKTLDICFQEKQVYDRMQVLRGEWEPLSLMRFEPFYYINKNNEIVTSHFHPDYDYTVLLKNAPMFPTRELAEEFLLIEKGEWQPKNDDIFFVCNEDLSDSECGTGEHEAAFDFTTTPREREFYFPSSAQRQAYIEKHKKPALPTVEELREAWGKERGELEVNPKISVTHDYIMACWKSRFIANKIRKAEGEMGCELVFGVVGKSSYRVGTRGGGVRSANNPKRHGRLRVGM